jgi:hypothetical protein
MSNVISPRRSTEVHSGGRGGAGNVDSGGGREYVDGGLYRTETPGADGQPYSTGRGGMCALLFIVGMLMVVRIWVSCMMDDGREKV